MSGNPLDFGGPVKRPAAPARKRVDWKKKHDGLLEKLDNEHAKSLSLLEEREMLRNNISALEDRLEVIETQDEASKQVIEKAVWEINGLQADLAKVRPSMVEALHLQMLIDRMHVTGSPNQKLMIWTIVGNPGNGVSITDAVRMYLTESLLRRAG